ncbi:uncharacterized protein BT62DRAFT_1014207 [Guyanagaster necrorhizus]|uniref:Uncharacterized protein n=1 Tax=Guyanagaster necrorhizus TaxID=856835 RepID=A0A9P8AL48_9AGAR|nr:uncharacterized protein BT62DRAFT_1014207 [Guyanagaster necrorhizus MCA 3950]KAG7439251.1 hypothetical protein BT62DRAFT_1014207 [Guyanagaster necrorhizus MCA 3950]
MSSKIIIGPFPLEDYNLSASEMGRARLDSNQALRWHPQDSVFCDVGTLKQIQGRPFMLPLLHVAYVAHLWPNACRGVRTRFFLERKVAREASAVYAHRPASFYSLRAPYLQNNDLSCRDQLVLRFKTNIHMTRENAVVKRDHAVQKPQPSTRNFRSQKSLAACAPVNVTRHSISR